MRDDIKDLIESRKSWQIHNDPILRDLREARSIALKEKDHSTVAIIDDLIQAQTEKM